MSMYAKEAVSEDISPTTTASHSFERGAATRITHGADIDHAAEARLLRKCDFRVMPLICWIYLLQHLDRTNVGNARILGFEKDLHLRGGQFGGLISIFTVGIILMCIPGNLIIRKVHPGRYLGGVAVFWGIMTLCTGFVRDYGQALGVRFLCGFCESLYWPAALYYVVHYYKRYELQRRYVFMLASTILSGAFGGLFAFALSKLDGRAGLTGWQWIFMVEGLLTCVSGLVGILVVPNWPDRSDFLNDQEQSLLALRLKQDVQEVKMDHLDAQAWKLILSDWKIYVGFLMHCCAGAAGYAVTYFQPSILHGLGYSATKAQVMSIPVYVTSTVCVLALAQVSDRIQHRFGFLLFGVSLGLIGFALLLAKDVPYGVKYFALFLAAIGFYIQIMMTITWSNNNFAGYRKRAVGSAIATGMGNASGLIVANIYPTDEGPRYAKGLSINLGLCSLLGMLAVVFFAGLRVSNARRRAGKYDGRLQWKNVDNLGDAHPSFRYTF